MDSLDVCIPDTNPAETDHVAEQQWLSDRNALIESHLELVRVLAWEVRGRMEWADLIGIGNLGLVKAANAFDPLINDSFRAYASIIIRREFRDEFRRKEHKLRTASLNASNDPHDPDDIGPAKAIEHYRDKNVPQQVIDKERAALVRNLLDGLPDPQRTYVVMRYCDDIGPDEIAKRQDAARSGVMKQIANGLEKMRATLRESRDPEDHPPLDAGKKIGRPRS
jgi:RNA polymerase sigma factor (sigma-70 family)